MSIPPELAFGKRIGNQLNLLNQIATTLFRIINLDEPVIWLDAVMKYISSDWLWVAVVLGFLAYRKLRHRRWEIGFFLTGAVGIGIADSVSYLVFKPAFARLRPCRDEEVMARIVDSCSGVYGLPSNHACNGMVLATLFMLFFPGPKAWMVFLMPLAVGYSRVYLGVHYPGDIFFGFAWGAMVAFAMKAAWDFGKARFATGNSR